MFVFDESSHLFASKNTKKLPWTQADVLKLLSEHRASIFTAAACFESTVTPPPQTRPPSPLASLVEPERLTQKKCSTTSSRRSSSIIQQSRAPSSACQSLCCGSKGFHCTPQGDCGYSNKHWLTSGSSEWGSAHRVDYHLTHAAFLRADAGWGLTAFLSSDGWKLIWEQRLFYHMSSVFDVNAVIIKELQVFNQ